jgi:LuxR family transcriptional regulator, activator of tox operons
MEAFRLNGNASAASDHGFAGGAPLINSIGTLDFSPTLFRTAYELTKTEHLSAFSFRSQSSPRILVAENTGRYPVSSAIARQYSERYWRHDLANKLSLLSTAPRSAFWVVRTTASEISDVEYRSDCYTSAGLEDRISVSQTSDENTIRLNFYRSRGDAFSQNEANKIFETAEVLIALLRQHEGRDSASEKYSENDFKKRLSQLAVSLSSREVDICTGILQGITSEGIALKLRLGLSTVQTHRKRAYARLGISSQNELMRLVMK